MEKRVDAAVVVEPVLQIEPAAHRVHGLGARQLFEQRRGVGPREPAQLQQPEVDARGEERAQIVVERREVGRIGAFLQERQQLRAQLDDQPQVAGRRGEVAQHAVARGFEVPPQPGQRDAPADRIGGGARRVEVAFDARGSSTPSASSSRRNRSSSPSEATARLDRTVRT